eukprot:augustus_masked-scaffold_36-processed-gene-2.31-mRNA-1 protein AED:1.00 eAED:1.00 QI:0/0/0/0/1/1/2/0/561
MKPNSNSFIEVRKTPIVKPEPLIPPKLYKVNRMKQLSKRNSDEVEEENSVSSASHPDHALFSLKPKKKAEFQLKVLKKTAKPRYSYLKKIQVGNGDNSIFRPSENYLKNSLKLTELNPNIPKETSSLSTYPELEMEKMTSQKLYKALSGPVGEAKYIGKNAYQNGLFIDTELSTVTLDKNSTAKERIEEGSLLGEKDWWERKVKEVETWFKRNPLYLGLDDETKDVIRFHLRLGNAATSKHRRILAWKHVSLEFHRVPNSSFAGHCESPSKGPLLVTPRGTESRRNNSPLSLSSMEEKSISIRSPLTPPSEAKCQAASLQTEEQQEMKEQDSPFIRQSLKNLTKMSLLERQNFCSMKKKYNIWLNQKIKDNKEIEGCTFEPELVKSPLRKKYESTKSVLKEYRDRAFTFESTPKSKVSNSTKTTRSPKKKKKIKMNIWNETSPKEAPSQRLEDPLSKRLVAKTQNIDELTYRFCPRTSDDAKGRINLQEDLSMYDPTSFYRRRDSRSSKQSWYNKGVSLLIGVREDTLKEQPVAVYFNRDLFSEKDACEYVLANKERFLAS